MNTKSTKTSFGFHIRILAPVLYGNAHLLIIGLFCLWFAAFKCAAANDIWTGGGTDNDWTTPANWGGTAPSPGDSLGFGFAVILGPTESSLNDFADGTAFGGITVSGNASTDGGCTCSGNRIVLTNGIAVSGGLLASQNANARFFCDITLGANQTFFNNRSLTFSNILDLNGKTVIFSNSANCSIEGAVTNANESFDGEIRKEGAGKLTVASTAQFLDLFDQIFVLVGQGSLAMNGTASNDTFFVATNGSIVLDGTAFVAETDGSNATVSGTGMATFIQTGVNANFSAANGGFIIPGDNGNPGILTCDSFSPENNERAPSTLEINIKGTVPGTNYSQLTVISNYSLAGVFFDGTLLAANLNVKLNYAAQIGDSFLILKSLSGIPYNFAENVFFNGLVDHNIYNTTNGYSLGISYDINGVTLTTLRTPTNSFLLWEGVYDLTSGFTNRNWSCSNNWADGVAPGAGDELNFSTYEQSGFNIASDVVETYPPFTNDLSPGTTLDSLSFSGSNYVLYGNALTLTSGITNNAGNGTNFCHLDMVITGPFALESDTGATLLETGSFNGSGSINKEGGGTVIYTGTTMKQFGGSVVVDNGTLQVDGSFLDGSFTVNGGLLDGTGTVSAVTMNGGTLKPGDSPGILHVEGNLAMAPGSVFESELNSPVPGTGYDQLQVDGTVNLNGATLNLQPGYNAAVGTAFFILFNDGSGPIVGTFAGLPEGTVFEAGGQFFSITYQAGSGNDVVVTRVKTPGNLSSVQWLNVSNVQLQGFGGSNLVYTIQANTNLGATNWVNIGTATANGAGLFFLTDSNASSYPQRFYRIQSP